MNIVEWTFEEFESNMVRNPKTMKYEPLGFFLVEEDSETYSAIDNSTGCPWVESFSGKDCKARAVNWLKYQMNKVG